MKKYIEENISYIIDKKILITLILSIVLINFVTFYYVMSLYTNINITVWEFIFYMNSNQYNIIYSYSTIIIFLVMYLYRNKANLNYKVIRYGNYDKWVKEEVKKVAFVVLAFLVILVLVQLLVGLPNLRLSNEWTTGFKDSKLFMENTNYFNPLKINIYNLILIYVYLVIVGTITFLSCIKIKNKLFIFLLSNSINLISISAYVSDNKLLKSISIMNNITFSKLYEKNIMLNNYMIKNVVFWGVVIILLLLIYRLFLKKLDLFASEEI